MKKTAWTYWVLALAMLRVTAPVVADETPTATPTPAPAIPLSVSEVVPVEGASAAELYNRAKLWFAKAFVSSNNVLQVQDKEAGMLMGKGLYSYEPNVFMSSKGTRGAVHFSVSIQVKDGRYKYEITDFTHKGTGGRQDFGLITTAETSPNIEDWNSLGMTKKAVQKLWKHLQARSKEEGADLAKNLKDGMQKPAKDENW